MCIPTAGNYNYKPTIMYTMIIDMIWHTLVCRHIHMTRLRRLCMFRCFGKGKRHSHLCHCHKVCHWIRHNIGICIHPRHLHTPLVDTRCFHTCQLVPANLIQEAINLCVFSAVSARWRMDARIQHAIWHYTANVAKNLCARTGRSVSCCKICYNHYSLLLTVKN